MLKELPDGCYMLCPSERPFLHYMALGRVFGLQILYAACRHQLTTIGVSLTVALLKIICERKIFASDVSALDPVYFRNRMAVLLEPGGVEAMKAVLMEDDLFFVDTDERTGDVTAELKPGGATIPLTEENKLEFVMLLSEHYLCGSIRKELAEFLAGLWDIVPPEALRECGIDERDLSLLISGIPTIDVDSWKEHTIVQGSRGGGDSGASGGSSQEEQQVVSWLWDVLRQFSAEDKAKVLQFCTGMSRLPPQGFAGLRGTPSGPFKVHLIQHRDPRALPTAHTCFNTLELPIYTCEKVLREKLAFAVLEGSIGFGLI